MVKDFSNLSQVVISPILLSRGTGEIVKRDEVTVYDYMPRILGDRFRAVGELRERAHFYGEHTSAPYLICEEAHKAVAREELRLGNLNAALDSYKNALESKIGFVGAISAIQAIAMLNPEEIQRLNIGPTFEEIESRLLQGVVSQDVAFDLAQYKTFVEEARTLKRDAFHLSQIYFFGAKGNPWEDMAGMRNPTTGAKLRDTYDRMRRFSDAAWISRELGDKEGEVKYEELAKTQPKDNPKFKPICDRLYEEWDEAKHGPFR